MANGLNGLFLKLIKTENGFLLHKAKQSGTKEYCALKRWKPNECE